MKKINLVIYLTVAVVIIAISIAGVFVYFYKPKVSDINKTTVNKNADVNNSNSVPALVTPSEVSQDIQNYQEEIIENSEKHKDDFKSISTDSNEKIVIITTYSRKIFDRTEYALGIKYSDFKNLDSDKSNLKNESKDLTADSKNFIQKVINNLKSSNTSELIKLTDPKIIEIAGEDDLIKKYSQYFQYFEDYKFHDVNNGFATTLIDDSVVLLESFINDKSENKMFGIVLSKTNNKYLLNEIFPGETSVIVAFSPEQNKLPIIVGNPVKGFDRKDLAEIGGSVLMPKGWYFRHELKNGTEAYFISKEEIIGDNGMFETGLTLNVIQRQNIPGGDAEKYMNSYIDNFSKNYPGLADNSGKAGDFIYRELVGLHHDQTSSWYEILRMIVNTKTNTLYLIIFESTPEKWDIEWNTNGKTIIDYLSLDANY